MRVAQVRKMCARNQRDAGNRQDRFRNTVSGKQRGGHETKAQDARNQGPCLAMMESTQSQRESPDRDRGCQSVTMDFGRKQERTAHAQRRNKDQAEDAVHHAQAGQKNTGPVESFAQGKNHA